MDNIKKLCMKSYKHIRKHYIKAIISLVSDLLWIVLTILAGAYIIIKIFINLYNLAEMIGFENIYVGEEALKQVIQNEAKFLSIYHAILGYTVLLVVSIVIIYIIFQSISWFLSYDKKIKYKKCLARFTLITLFWLIPSIIIFILYTRLSMSAFFSMYSIVTQDTINIIAYILLLIIAYFAIIAYSIIPYYNIKKIIKTQFKIGYKHFFKLIKSYIMVIFMFLIGFAITYGFRFNLIAMAVISIIIFLPLLHYARVFLNSSISQQKH